MINNPFHPQITIKGNKKNVPKGISLFSFTPVIFETKKQYVNELVHNQEKLNHTHFSHQQKEQFKRQELKKMQPVVARYTTHSNPFMKPEMIFFTDRKITPDRMREMSRHEFQHQAWEPFDSGRNKNMAWDVAKAQEQGFYVEKMKPEEYLARTSTSPDAPYLESYHDIETERSEPIEKLGQRIKDPNVRVALPYVGYTPEEHEGRHRAVAVMRENPEQEIPVIVPRPETHRTSEVVEKFIEKRFPDSEVGYREEWKGRFRKSFPEEHMDKETLKAYKETLKEKGIEE